MRMPYLLVTPVITSVTLAAFDAIPATHEQVIVTPNDKSTAAHGHSGGLATTTTAHALAVQHDGRAASGLQPSAWHVRPIHARSNLAVHQLVHHCAAGDGRFQSHRWDWAPCASHQFRPFGRDPNDATGAAERCNSDGPRNGRDRSHSDRSLGYHGWYFAVPPSSQHTDLCTFGAGFVAPQRRSPAFHSGSNRLNWERS